MLEIDPNEPEALGALAHIHLVAGDLTQARNFLDRALKLNPEHAGLQLLQAKAFFAQKKTQKALTHIRKSLRLNPNQAEAQLLLGDVMWERGMKPMARQAWEAALHLEPGLDIAQQRLARVE